MSTLLWYAPIGAMQVLGAFITALVIAVMVWAALRAFRPWSRYPWPVVWILTALIAVNGIARDVPDIRASLAGEASVPDLQRVNEVYQTLLADVITREHALVELRGLAPDRWSSDAAEMALSVIVLKSERYVDVYQSFMAGQVVRSEVSIGGRFARELDDIDRRVWDPLLEAAAAGGPVELTAGNWASSVEDAYWNALLATRSRLVLMESLEELYAVPVPLSPVDRAVAPALEWLAVVFTLPGDGVGAETAFSALEAVAEATWSDIRTDAYADLRQQSPDFVESLTAFFWAQELLDLEYARWLVASALGTSHDLSIDDIDAHRRLIGMPTGFTKDDLAVARGSGVMPHTTVLAGLDVDETLLAELEWRVQEVNQRYERLEPGMRPLTIEATSAARAR